MSKKKLPEREVLEALHWEEKMTLAAISRRYGATAAAVSLAFKRLGIPARSPPGRPRSKLPANDELLRLYWDEEMSLAMIAKQFNASASTVYSMFKRHGIKMRTRTECAKLRHRREQQ